MPTQNNTPRMRAWRALKAAGAAVLRDGVYLIPDRPDHQDLLGEISRDVIANEGSAFTFTTQTEDTDLSRLFDRRDEYLALQADLQSLAVQIARSGSAEDSKQLRKLRKHFTALTAIDFFPNEIQLQTQQLLQNLELQLSRQLSPNEPSGSAGVVLRRDIEQYRNRTWATRRRPWVDRLASAWLIHRFIDPQARFLWLDAPDQCPAEAVGFDFDSAEFTHMGDRVTFEVLLASFALQDPALVRLGTLVHYLDIGGLQPLEAGGLEQILWGLRNSIAHDDQLLAAAEGVFDALLSSFTYKEQL